MGADVSWKDTGARSQMVSAVADSKAGRRRRRRSLPTAAKPHIPVDLRWQRPTPEVLTRLANVPSRDDLERRELRADFAENCTRWNDWLWRRVRRSGSALVDTTWAQMAIGCGYQPTAKVLRSLQRYADLFAEAGLITYGGATDGSGAYRCLHIQVVEPPPLPVVMRRSSSAGQAPLPCEGRRRRATPVLCAARRRNETPTERAARRRQPWRRTGGRAEVVERRTLSWRPISAYPSFGENGPYGLRPRGAVRSLDECARARGTGDQPDTNPSGQAQQNGSGEEGGGTRRRGFRKPKRQAAAIERFTFRNEQLVLELLLCGDLDGGQAAQRITAIRAGVGRC